MPTRASRIEAIKRAFAARVALNAELFSSHFSPECTIKIVGNRSLNPSSGVRVGLDGVRSYIRDLSNDFSYSDLMIDTIMLEGEHAAVHWHVSFYFKRTLRSEDFQCLDLLRFNGSLIEEMTHFYDSASVALLNGRI